MTFLLKGSRSIQLANFSPDMPKVTNDPQMKSPLITEQSSLYDNLEDMSSTDILESINREDQKVALAVREVIPRIVTLVDALIPRFEQGGRLFYMGAGTSGRLGVLDASEIPPTYGMPPERVIGLIAGGDGALRNSVEEAEDSPLLGRAALEEHDFTAMDTVIGIAASGTTPYVLGAVAYGQEVGAVTGCITNNPDSPLSRAVAFPIEVVVGPEFVTGSTRMKSGTAQKLVLNMISTTLMIKTGRVKGNKMVHMQLNNAKLINRGIRFLMEELDVTKEEAEALLQQHGSVKAALVANQHK